MSPDNLPSPKDRAGSFQGPNRKPPAAQDPPHNQQPLKCPRCNSSNTKFCYYNNYSLSQPRHFCKTCRRYWTKGGALRNVPVGGGSRKTNKKALKASSSSPGDITGFRAFFDHGLVNPPAFDYHLGGLNLNRLVNTSPSAASLFHSNNDSSSNHSIPLSSNSYFNLDLHCGSSTSLMGFGNLPLIQDTTNPVSSIDGVNSNLASSIESLSNLNQDLHFKLQQQRMGLILGHVNDSSNSVSEPSVISRAEKPQPILFRNLDMDSSRQKGGGKAETAMTEWFFGNSSTTNEYAPASVISTPAAMSGEGSNAIVSEGAINHDQWNGVQAWCGFQHHYD